MSSPITEVKPSQVAQLMKENAKLKEDNEKLKKENYILFSFQKEVDQMEAGLYAIDEDYEDMQFYELPDVIKTLKAENETLKAEVDILNTYRKEMEKIEAIAPEVDDIVDVKEVIEKLKGEKDGYFQAWLHYWSDGTLGEEYSTPMSEMEGGKYQEQLDKLDEDEDE